MRLSFSSAARNGARFVADRLPAARGGSPPVVMIHSRPRHRVGDLREWLKGGR